MNDSRKLDKQHAFDSFCKKVLKNEVRNYYKEMERLRNNEVSFSELTAAELDQLSATDRYFATAQIFNVQGNDIIVNSDSLSTALKTLPQNKRDIILLSYFLELSDMEIGEKLNLIRSTVQYRRSSALRELRKFLRKEFFDG